MNWKTKILYGFLVALDIAKVFFLAYCSFMSMLGTRICWGIHTPIIVYFVFLMFAHIMEMLAYIIKEEENSRTTDWPPEAMYILTMLSFGFKCVESLAILLLLVSELSLSPEESFCGTNELQCFFSVFQKSR